MWFWLCWCSVFLRSVTVHLPKFSISADASLVDTLKEFGVTDAFSDNADLSGMSAEVALKVSKVGSANRPSRVCWTLPGAFPSSKYRNVFRGLLLNSPGYWLTPPPFSPADISPGCAQRGWNWNRGSSRQHHWSHAYEHARRNDTQQALLGLHPGALYQEHPLHGQDQQPHSRVKMLGTWPVDLCCIFFTLQ